MTHRISDERLASLIVHVSITDERDIELALEELQQSRALISQLRELAERMRTRANTPSYKLKSYEYIAVGATQDWLSELESILSAHGAQVDTSWYEGEVDREVVKEVIDLKSSQADAEGKS